MSEKVGENSKDSEQVSHVANEQFIPREIENVRQIVGKCMEESAPSTESISGCISTWQINK